MVGAFLPGEVIVVAGGFLAASGELNLTTVVIVSCLGAVVGTNASYALGRWGGRALIEALARRFRVNGRRLDGADRYFSTHGPITVFVGRYLSGVKARVPALAGAHRMKWSRFIVFAVLGITSWTIIAAVLGYYFGQNWEALTTFFKTVGWAIPIVGVLVLLALWQRRRGRA